MGSTRRRRGLGTLLAVVAGSWWIRRRRARDGEAVAVPWPPVPPEPPATERRSGHGGEAASQTVAPGPTWVEPRDGECPDGHPVKVKLRSGLFHLPGMAAYRRTRPDRCYRSADDAIADGFRAASR